MSSLNKVMIIGRLGKDPELKFTQNGNAVCNLSVATSEKWKDKQGDYQEKTEWNRCVAWGNLAENCGEYLAKGRQVYVEGKLQTRKWQDKDGNDRYTTEIVARDVVFLGGRSDNAGGDDRSHGQDGTREGQRSQTRSNGGGYPAPIPDDDVPF